MSTPKIFKSSDTGAPLLTSSAGGMNAILKACLVNGFGAKEPIGWDLVFEEQSSNKLVLRSKSPDSDKSCYLFTDSSAESTTVQGFSSWLGSAGVGPFSTSNRYILRRANGALKGSYPWIVVADDKSCWIVVMNTATSNTCVPAFFGDFNGFNGLKKHSAIIAPGGTIYNSSVAMTSLTNKNSAGLAPNDSTVSLGSGSISELYGFGNHSAQVLLVDGDYRLFQPVKLYEALGATTWRLAGLLPGYLFCDVFSDWALGDTAAGMIKEHTNIAGMPNQTVIEFKVAWGGTHFINISEW